MDRLSPAYKSSSVILGFEKGRSQWSDPLLPTPSTGALYHNSGLTPEHLLHVPRLNAADPSSAGHQAMRLMWTTVDRQLERLGIKDKCTLRLMEYQPYRDILAVYIDPIHTYNSDLVNDLLVWGEHFFKNNLCNDARYLLFRIFFSRLDGTLIPMRRHRLWAPRVFELTEREAKARAKRHREAWRQRVKLEVQTLMAEGKYDKALEHYRDVSHIGHRRVTRAQGQLLKAQQDEKNGSNPRRG
jgi:hypothetical protein